MRETTALGAAIAAGFAVKVWKNFSQLRNINRAGGTIFEPKISAEESKKLFGAWEKAVNMSKGWVDVDGKGTVGQRQQAAVNGESAAAAVVAKKRVDSGVGGVDDFGSLNGLEGLDEEDLRWELRKIEIQQRLKKLKNGKV